MPPPQEQAIKDSLATVQKTLTSIRNHNDDDPPRPAEQERPRAVRRKSGGFRPTEVARRSRPTRHAGTLAMVVSTDS